MIGATPVFGSGAFHGAVSIHGDQMKAILFGDPDVRMTKRRCEEFFDNDDNFVLGNEHMEETLIWAAEKMGVPYARIAHA
jgi:hypothetical protein